MVLGFSYVFFFLFNVLGVLADILVKKTMVRDKTHNTIGIILGLQEKKASVMKIFVTETQYSVTKSFSDENYNHKIHCYTLITATHSIIREGIFHH